MPQLHALRQATGLAVTYLSTHDNITQVAIFTTPYCIAQSTTEISPGKSTLHSVIADIHAHLTAIAASAMVTFISMPKAPLPPRIQNVAKKAQAIASELHERSVRESRRRTGYVNDTAVKVPQAAAIRHVKCAVRSHWLHQWKTAHGHSHLYSLKPTPKLTHPVTHGNRRIAAMHTRLRHNIHSLNEHLAKIGKVPSPICECQEATESITHYLLHCRHYEEQRKHMMDDLTEKRIELPDSEEETIKVFLMCATAPAYTKQNVSRSILSAFNLYLLTTNRMAQSHLFE